MTNGASSRVSVVIPSYNHGRYLPQAIDSALAQTLPPAEIIVVDDGSSDDTPTVTALYGPPVHLIQQNNRGLSAARNTGIQAATGEYVAFLDADDLWLPEFLVTLVPLLDADPALGAAHGGCRFIDAAGSPLPQTTTRVVPPSQVHDVLIDGDFFPAHAVLARRACLDRVGLFDETLRANEDWDMWLRFSNVYPMAGTPQIIALYRMHGDNMSANLMRMHESQLAIATKHFGPAEGAPATWPRDRRRIYAGVYLWRALAHYRRGEAADGLAYAQQALVTFPALATSVDALYALACAEQRPGYMGDVAGANLTAGAQRVQAVLQATFTTPITAEMAAVRSHVYATAQLALGLLAYASGHSAAARGYLLTAVRHQPALVTDPRWVNTFARSLTPAAVRQILRRKTR